MVKISWIDILLIVLGLIIAYQLVLKIVGGSWMTEAIIIALLFFNLGITWKINMSLVELEGKFNGHMR